MVDTFWIDYMFMTGASFLIGLVECAGKHPTRGDPLADFLSRWFKWTFRIITLCQFQKIIEK